MTLATGGDEVFDIDVSGTTYRVHKFTTVGTSTLTVLKGGQVEYLLVQVRVIRAVRRGVSRRRSSLRVVVAVIVLPARTLRLVSLVRVARGQRAALAALLSAMAAVAVAGT
jgi:hypothetical protein